MPKLTARAVEAIKPDPARRREIPDELLPGLYLLVQRSGAKSWACRFRSPLTKRVVKLTLGPYPSVGIADARAAARRAFADVAEGRDPTEEKRAARAATRDVSDTVRPLLERWLEHVMGRRRESTAGEYRRLAAREILPVLGDRKLADVRRRDVIALAEAIADRGAPIVANRALAIMRSFGNWALSRDLIDVNPASGVRSPAAEVSRDRVLTDTELRLLWSATAAVGWPFGPLIRVLALTGQRREEVAGMRWDELDLEGEAPVWVLARSRTKNNSAHVVPLSPDVVEIIRALPRVGNSELVFSTTGKTAPSGFSKAKSAIDRRVAALVGGASIPSWRLHDLRRTAASNMARLGTPVHVVEAVLNHKSGAISGVAAIYNRHSYADEKRQALNALANFTAEIVGAPGERNVVLMRGRS